VRAARAAAALCSAVALLGVVPARAGGFLGIDHRWAYDDSGVWRRSNQLILMDSLIGGEVLCALWEGGQTHFGNEVAAVSSIVTPFIFGYRDQAPAVWALEALPLYDAIARMKVQAHWQTDVLAGWAIGTAAGYYAHARDNPLVLGVMPHGIVVGLRHQF
jgi:hypothetical protein